MKNRSIQNRQAWVGFAFTVPALLGMLLFFLIPFLLCILLALSDGVGGTFVGLQNFRTLIQNAAFRLAVRNTCRFTVVAIPLLLLLSLGFALLLHQKISGSTFFRTVFLFPYVLPVASVVFFFQQTFSQNGAVNQFLVQMAHERVDWFHGDGALTVLLLLFLWKNLGYHMILFLAALQSVPHSCQEAAQLDGAGSVQVFCHITMPLMVPYLFVILVISMIHSFRVFREAYLLFGAYPPQDIYLLQHFMNNHFHNANYPSLASGAILFFLMIACLVLLLYWLRRKAGEST